MALLNQFGQQDEEILKRMKGNAPVSQGNIVYDNPSVKPIPNAPKQGFLGRIGAGLQDPETLLKLGMIFSSMGSRSQALVPALQANLESMQSKRQANATAERFRAMGREDLAQMIEQNPSMALDLTKAYYSSQFKSPSAFSEKVDALVAANVPRAEAVKMVATSSGTTVNLPSGAETAMYKAASDRDFALQDQAIKAASQIAGLDQTIDLIQSGEANIGMASQFQQELARMKAFFGDEESIKSASSTALLNALLGQDVFGAISNLGIGARGLDTPAEREFLRDVLTGTTRMTPEALLKMTNLRKKYAEKVIEKYNDAIDRGQYKYMSDVLGPERFQKIDYISLDQLNNPPSGVDLVTWSYMSRDEKIQYLNEAKGAGN